MFACLHQLLRVKGSSERSSAACAPGWRRRRRRFLHGRAVPSPEGRRSRAILSPPSRTQAQWFAQCQLCAGLAWSVLGRNAQLPARSAHVALPADRDTGSRPRRHDDALPPSGQLCSESRPFMVSATNGRQSTHTTSAEGWHRAAFAASPTRPPANAAHADRTLNPASARPRSHSSSRRPGRSNTEARRVPPRSLNRQQAIRT